MLSPNPLPPSLPPPQVKLIGAEVEVSVNIDLESLSGSRLKESYKDFKVNTSSPLIHRP